MSGNIKYAHTNLVAKDWKQLARFYIDVFGCIPIYPERNLAGKWIDRVTLINDVKIKGIHLALPGYENGPTLEIFQYEPENLRETQINSQGFGHIAFLVDSVEDVFNKLLSHGGKALGEIITKEYEGIGMLTLVYAKDPEGNFIEIQKWSK